MQPGVSSKCTDKGEMCHIPNCGDGGGEDLYHIRGRGKSKDVPLVEPASGDHG